LFLSRSEINAATMLPEPDIASHPRAVLTPIADRRARLATLRVRLAQLERHEGHAVASCLSLGVPEIRAHLPTPGLAGGVLHAMAGATYGDRPAAFGFVIALMAIAAPGSDPLLHRSEPHTRVDARGLTPTQRTGPAFLAVTRRALADFGRPYGRGLSQAGLDPNRLILIETSSDKDALWALEEVLGSDARPCVVAGAIEAPLSLTESRRLNLAAARCGTPLLVLGAPGQTGRQTGTQTGRQTGTSAAATRWRIAAAPAGRDRFRALAQPRWRIALERCRHGRAGEWLIEWDHAAYCFRLAQGVADRTPAAGARPERTNWRAG
jgi:protein ImuA